VFRQDVHRGTLVEEVHRFEFETGEVGRQHRPVLRTVDVVHAERVPEDDVLAVQRPVLFGPGGESRTAGVLVRIVPGREPFVLVVRGRPEVGVDERRPFDDTRLGLGCCLDVLAGDQSVPDGPVERVGHVRVLDLPVASPERVDVVLGLLFGFELGPAGVEGRAGRVDGVGVGLPVPAYLLVRTFRHGLVQSPVEPVFRPVDVEAQPDVETVLTLLPRPDRTNDVSTIPKPV
jgi:hypothetical protein